MSVFENPSQCPSGHQGNLARCSPYLPSLSSIGRFFYFLKSKPFLLAIYVFAKFKRFSYVRSNFGMPTCASKSFGLAMALGLALIFQGGQALAAESVQQLQVSGARVVADPKTGVTRFVGFDSQTVLSRAALAGDTSNATMQQMSTDVSAAQHLSNYGSLFGLQDPAMETRSIKHRVHTDGRAMTRYKQHHQGIPVIAGELIVNQTAQRQLTSISGKISPNLKLDTMPVFTAAEAQAIARTAMAKWYQLPPDEFVVPEPQLSIYDSRLMSPHTDPVALVWRLDVTTKGLRPINEFLAIDAKTGTIALHFNQVPHAKSRMTYQGSNTLPLTQTLVCDESNPACAGGSSDAVNAHRYAGKTYDFYLTNFGRDGIDGAGMSMISTVGYCLAGETCPNYPNASWTGTQMVYGQGYGSAEDVVGHELTHGVTQYESGLFYYYQSGAISESLSDIFGEFIQQSGPSTVTPQTKWLIGENLAGGKMRSMSVPTDMNDPDKMTSSYYFTGTTNLLVEPKNGDYGGVHTNSGVGNKAAYLMTDGSAMEPGGKFNGVTVVGLGLTKVAKIYYEAQTNLLTSGSDYLDLYNSLYQACQNLVGSSGIVASDCQQVRNATNAVEMSGSPVAGFNPEAPVCSAGLAPNNLYVWYGDSMVGTSPVWRINSTYAKSGYSQLYGSGELPFSNATFVNNNRIVVPQGAFMRFDHSFEFEEGLLAYYDGGNVAYSTSPSGPWTLLTTPIAGRAYSGNIASWSSNPLAGQQAFSGASHGYVSTRFDLSSLAGQALYFAFILGTDGNTNSLGWTIDNWRFYTCTPGFELAYSSTGAGAGTVSSNDFGIYACSLPCSAGYATGTTVTLAATAATGSVFTGWSGACTGLGTCSVTMNSAKSVTANFALINDGFPGRGSIPPGWIQPAGSTAPWTVTNDPTHAGWSLKSGPIGNGQSSDLSYTTNFLAGNVSFARRVSSEPNYDLLLFYIDDVLQDFWSGEVAWSTVSFPISAGTHTLEWRYMKDSSHAINSDAAWIDSVMLPVVPISCSLKAVPAQVKPGQATTLTASCAPAAATYAWTGAGCVGNTTATCTATPATTTAFGVTGINGSGLNTVSTVVKVRKAVDLTPILNLLLN